MTNFPRLATIWPRSACLWSHRHFQLGVRRALACRERLECGSSRRTGGEGVRGGLLLCCRVLAQQHRAGKMFILSKFPSQEATNSPRFPVFTFTSKTAQFWAGFVWHEMLSFHVSADCHSQAWLHVYLKPMNYRGARAKDLTVAHRLPNKECAEQMPAECSGIHFNQFGCGQKRQVLQGLWLLGWLQLSNCFFSQVGKCSLTTSAQPSLEQIKG